MFYQTALGSSPRVWGQARQLVYFSSFPGIIPTRVGTSTAACLLFLFSGDHPHACGDKICSRQYAIVSGGSSPRVWGQVLTAATEAEKLFHHPHACGDKFSVIYIRFFIPGSSPHVWGQVPFFAIVKHIFRIIPTRVGTRLRKRSFYPT